MKRLVFSLIAGLAIAGAITSTAGAIQQYEPTQDSNGQYSRTHGPTRFNDGQYSRTHGPTRFNDGQ